MIKASNNKKSDLLAEPEAPCFAEIQKRAKSPSEASETPLKP